MGVVNHYYVENNKTKFGDFKIDKNSALQADPYLIEVNKTLGRKYPTSKEYVNDLLRRNYFQVVNSYAIYAISTFDKNGLVSGGTGWAVHLGVNMNKSVHVFDQSEDKWYFMVGHKSKYQIDTPTITKEFAGIGTRKINKKGKNAIYASFKRTCDVHQQKIEN